MIVPPTPAQTSAQPPSRGDETVFLNHGGTHPTQMAAMPGTNVMSQYRANTVHPMTSTASPHATSVRLDGRQA